GVPRRDRRAAAASERLAHRRHRQRLESRDQAAAARARRRRGHRRVHPPASQARVNKGLLSVDEALAQLLDAAKALPDIEQVPTLEATGRVLAKAQRSTMDVPPMDNSAMDGYALRISDLQNKNTLLVKQRIMAGSVGKPLEPGTAARIFTG